MMHATAGACTRPSGDVGVHALCRVIFAAPLEVRPDVRAECVLEASTGNLSICVQGSSVFTRQVVARAVWSGCCAVWECQNGTICEDGHVSGTAGARRGAALWRVGQLSLRASAVACGPPKAYVIIFR